jgi:DNA-directed RNA polymerase delta subunit
MEQILKIISDNNLKSQLASFKPVALSTELLTTLSERDSWVLDKRYGLKEGKSLTLEEIGKSLGVTRERVRQIESGAIKRIGVAPKVKKDILPVIDVILNEFGGMISLNKMAQIVVHYDPAHPYEKLLPALRFLMDLHPEIAKLTAKGGFHESYVLKSVKLTEIEKIQNQIKKFLKDTDGPMDFEAIAAEIKDASPKFTLGVLVISTEFGQDLNFNWGLSSWLSVNPKRIRDKVYLILKKLGKPLHFNDIAHEINTYYPSSREVLSRTVHNELIGDTRFVLVGRGIYALQEWGYESGTVADVIKDVLKEASSPLKSSDIIKEVLKRRKVKPNTVIANLHNRELFTKVDRATYTLTLSK